MFFFFGYPFLFFLPLIFLVLGVRLLARLLQGGRRQHYRQISTREEFLQRYMPEAFEGQLTGRTGESPEATVFKLAYRLKGRVTVSDLVIETGLPVEEAEQLIEQMVDGSRVRMEVDERGMITYEFPEIIARFDQQSGGPESKG
ncbi:hypothetical protein [Salinispira pacifica]